MKYQISFYKSLLTISCGLTFASSLFADTVAINFSNLKADESKETATPTILMDFLNGDDATKDIVSAIPQCRGSFICKEGLKDEYGDSYSGGALFVYASDPNTDEEGCVTFVINPERWVRGSKINITTFNYRDNPNIDGDPTRVAPDLEVSVNGGKYVTLKGDDATDYTKLNEVRGTFSLPIDGKVVARLSVKVPNVLSKLVENPDPDYYLAFQRFIIVYDQSEQKEETVTQWEFDERNLHLYLEKSTSLPLPHLLTQPEEIAELAEYSVSDTDVAEISDGNILFKKPGRVMLKAELPKNHVFIPSGEAVTAECEIVAEQSESSSIESIEGNAEYAATYYTINGLVISKPYSPGVYIRKRGNEMDKIIVK